MSILMAVVIALGLDYWLGEPKRLHPLVGFGGLADGLERWLNRDDGLQGAQRRGNLLQLNGAIALTLAIVPLGFAAYSLEQTLAAN
ncbi:MAG: cobalamin biosynthesis protein, partial [Oceanospirillaceae bacterium]|nr:cobalamin biosynthesis protein [Oceanospirillaceae bacterium]